MRFVRETGLNRFAGLASIALVFAMGAAARAETRDREALNLARGSMDSATFSQDGKYLLTAQSRIAQLWDIETGKEVRRFNGHLARVHNAVFSPDGKQVLTVAGRTEGYLRTGDPDDFTARLWDVATGAEIRCFKGHTRFVHTGLFSPDGKRLLTASRDWTAKLWDADTGKQLFVFTNLAYLPPAVAFSPDGSKILGYLPGDLKIQLWNAKTGETLSLIDGGKRSFRSAQFSPNGQYVLTACNDGSVLLWNARTGGRDKEFQGHTDSVVGATFSSDGKRIVTASKDASVRLWNAQSGNEIKRFALPGPVTSIILNRDGTRILAKWNRLTKLKGIETRQTFVSLWDAETGREIKQLELRPVFYIAIFSPDGKKVFLVTRKHATLLDATTGEMIHEYK